MPQHRKTRKRYDFDIAVHAQKEIASGVLHDVQDAIARETAATIAVIKEKPMRDIQDFAPGAQRLRRPVRGTVVAYHDERVLTQTLQHFTFLRKGCKGFHT